MAADPGPRAPRSAPVALPPARSLLTSVGSITDNEAGIGVSHVQGRAAALGQPVDWCSPGTISIVDACGQANRNGFLIVAGELRPSQSTFAANRVTFGERQQSARQNLELHKSYVIARELLYGAATQAGGWGNPYLTDANLSVVSLAAQPVNQALDRITDLWGDRMQGERGLIHMGPAVARALLRTYQVEERGGQLVDRATGNQLVVDAAYANASNLGSASEDPLSQVQWIFMTPNMNIYETEVQVFPATEEDATFAINRLANTITVFASEVVTYTYEQPAGTLPNLPGNPPVLGIPVDLCTADCLPGQS